MVVWLLKALSHFLNIGKWMLPIIILIGVATLPGVGPNTVVAQKYYNPTEYTLEYPQGWDFIDKTNVESSGKVLASREPELSPEYASAWRSAIQRVSGQLSSVVFWNANDNTEFNSVDVIIVKKELPIKLSSTSVLQSVLQNTAQIPKSPPKKTIPTIQKLGISRYMSLKQVFASPESDREIVNQSYLIKGNKRSLLISCTADAATLSKLEPAVRMLRTSLRDVRQINQGLLKLPAWLEMVIVAFFALVVVIVVRKTISEYSPRVRSHYDKSRGLPILGFLGMFIFVYLLLIGATFLFKL